MIEIPITPTSLIEAGARCLKGSCGNGSETQVDQDALIARIESIIDELQRQQRPRREARVRSFASRHQIGEIALQELIAWICDYREPASN